MIDTIVWVDYGFQDLFYEAIRRKVSKDVRMFAHGIKFNVWTCLDVVDLRVGLSVDEIYEDWETNPSFTIKNFRI